MDLTPLSIIESRASILQDTVVFAGGAILCFGVAALLLVGVDTFPVWIVFGILSLLFLTLQRGQPVDVLHPVRLFGCLWFFCLALASMRLLQISSEWDWLTWRCFVVAPLSFTFGFAITGQKERPMELVFEPMAERRTLKIALLCTLIGAAVLSYEYSLIGAIPILADNVDIVRMELFGAAGQGNPAFDRVYIKVLHFVVEFIKYGTTLCLVLLFQRRAKHPKVMFAALLVFVFGLVAYVSQGGRLFIFEVAVTALVLYHVLRKRFTPAQLVCGALVLLITLGFLGAARVRQSELAPAFQKGFAESRFPQGGLGEGLAFGYATVTTSFEVFHRLREDLETVEPPASGTLLYAFHRLVPRSNLQEFTFDLYGGEMIVPTFLGEFYTDFGFWGVLLGPLGLGVMYGFAYKQRFETNPAFAPYMQIVFTKSLLMFPYVNIFSQYLTWLIDLSFMYFIIRLCKQPSSARLERVNS